MIEIYQRADGEWGFRIKGKNGEPVAGGEGYTRKEDALRGYETLVRIVTDPESRVVVKEG